MKTFEVCILRTALLTLQANPPSGLLFMPSREKKDVNMELTASGGRAGTPRVRDEL